MLTIGLKSAYRGLGYSKVLYAWLIFAYAGIFSDESLSGGNPKKGIIGSFESWQWISKHFNTYYFDGGKGVIYPIKGGIKKSMMKSRGDKFLATAEPFDYIAYNKNNGRVSSSGNQEPEEMPVPDNSIKKKALSETPEFSDKDKSLGDDEIGKPSGAVLKQQYEVKTAVGIGLIQVYQYLFSKTSKNALLKLDTGEYIAQLEYEDDISEDSPFPVIEFVGVRPEYRGKGISKLMYEWIIKKYKGLISDSTLTGEEGYGSFQVWQSLAKTYKNIYMIDLNTTLVKPITAIDKSLMGKKHERFMLTVYPFDWKAHNAIRSQMSLANVE
jgi:GNAT superfamily N-acetyltransferase